MNRKFKLYKGFQKKILEPFTNDQATKYFQGKIFLFSFDKLYSRILPEKIPNMVIKVAGEEEGIRRLEAGKAVEARIQEV